LHTENCLDEMREQCPSGYDVLASETRKGIVAPHGAPVAVPVDHVVFRCKRSNEEER
jgi:hypothetical protein